MKFTELVQKSREDYYSLYEGETPVVMVGSATCGNSAGAKIVYDTFKDIIREKELDVKLLEVGCIGLCYAEPLVTIHMKDNPPIFYKEVTPLLAEELMESYLMGNDPLPEHALGHMGDEDLEGIPKFSDLPYVKNQVRRILRNCGFIDPKNIHHYLASGGYGGIDKALQIEPSQVIEKIKNSFLRGRGGAGFPTWLKWQLCRDEESKTKYLICNADEGDPGAFMNRSLLESDPHSVLEGILIAAYAIGAKEGYIYCRAEYPLALNRLKHALSDMRSYGFLGKNILGSKFSFDIKIKEGAGAFVCGEETALIASIEGKRGMPRTRPPFPTTSGLWGKPTVINNVETMASVTYIFQEGPSIFTEFGTEKSKGTKTFSLVGDIKNPGLIEVPLGTTLRQVIYDIGGGIIGDNDFKAVQIGGPSGGCIPNSFLDIRIDYDSLNLAGAIMGSGGLVVMDHNSCMVEVARYFLEFTQNESCGKCVPCRLGTKQMLDILTDITEGKGKKEDLALLQELAHGIRAGSLCGLGQTAPNPVLTTMRFFSEEYDAHLEKICPAKQCNELIDYQILAEKCQGCMLCLKSCPTGAVTGEKNKTHYINNEKCIKCGTCIEQCSGKYDAIKPINRIENSK